MKATYGTPYRRPKPNFDPWGGSKRAATEKQTFDQETGQVYHETEVPFRRKQNSDWIGEYRTPSITKKPKPLSKGSRSLIDTARSKCVADFRHFTPQHFETIPWSLASTIWGEVVSTHSESFHVWRTLAAAYSREKEFATSENRYLLQLRQPPLPIQDYFHGIRSLNQSWLVALRVSPKQIPIPDLIAIANITNLAVLDLSDGQLLLDATATRFDERIMRTWAELSSSGRAFQRLQVLLLGWQDSIANWIFEYLDSFPRLRHVITTDCKHVHQRNRGDWEHCATLRGWQAHHAKRSVKLLRPLLDDKEFHVAAISSLYYHSLEQEHKQNSQQAGCPEKSERLPVLECWLGTPRLWTHVVDEFPGTRTVWFEKVEPQSSIEVAISRTKQTEVDASKRVRGAGTRSPVAPSPPRKRPQGPKPRHFKASAATAASLLADMGM